MSPALARLAAWLVAPADDVTARAHAAAVPTRRAAPRWKRAPAGPPVMGASPSDELTDTGAAGPSPASGDLALLAAATDAAALGAALALKATRGVAAVGVWTGAEPPPPPAAPFRTPAARSLAASLAARGLVASASGRLVTVALPSGEEASAAAARRLLAVDVPVVLAVGGPRAAAWDDLLRECPLALVHAADAEIAALTIARLTEQGIAASALGSAPGAVARSLARAGLALPGGLGGLAPEAAS